MEYDIILILLLPIYTINKINLFFSFMSKREMLTLLALPHTTGLWLMMYLLSYFILV